MLSINSTSVAVGPGPPSLFTMVELRFLIIPEQLKHSVYATSVALAVRPPTTKIRSCIIIVTVLVYSEFGSWHSLPRRAEKLRPDSPRERPELGAF